jgi:MoaA/NifB/PqqE/SkfB family radical SAM enzyme
MYALYGNASAGHKPKIEPRQEKVCDYDSISAQHLLQYSSKRPTCAIFDQLRGEMSMTNQRPPTHIMGVSLLHKCNLSCEHCGYIYIADAEDHIIRPGYRLTWDQVMTAIQDCASLENSYWNVNYTGGEPTLWEEDGKDFTDILIATAKGGTLPTFNTNGIYFEDYDKCYPFFHKYAGSTDVPLKTFISMDKFHKNYDQENGRAKSLETIAKVLETFPAEQRNLLTVHVITIVTKDPNSSLPDEMKKYYGAMGVTFGDFPMLDVGKAKKLKDQQPEFSGFNFPLSKVEKGPPVLVLVGDDYYAASQKVGKLGHMLDLY